VTTKAEFEGRTFTAPDDRCEAFTGFVLRYVDADRPLRVLDLGCGTGRGLFHLARVLPRARLVGVDVSPSSIALAERARPVHDPEGRIELVAADYLEYRGGPFDLIVSDSTLQNIPASTAALFDKIRRDLADEGLLIATIPYGCATNHALWAVRRALRAVRGRWSDRLIPIIARLLHRSQFDEELLRQRLPYMYMLPLRYDGPSLRRLLSDRFALEAVAEQEEPRVSVAKPRHKIITFKKRPVSAREDREFVNMIDLNKC
jgi:SAM-dependent methyltransferase